MTEAQQGESRGRALAGSVALFFAPWAVYLLLLARQPDDRFAVWHNEVAWPAEHFLTEAQGGLWMPLFGYVMFGAIGGMFVGMILVLLARAASRLLKTRDLSGAASTLAMIAMPVWAFVVFKAVPRTVTEIDPEAHTLTVREFHWALRYPVQTRTIGGQELAAIDLTSWFRKRDGTRYLEIHAMLREGGSVLLAMRPCDTSDEAACLSSGDADIVELARWLGREGAAPGPAVREGHHLLLLRR